MVKFSRVMLVGVAMTCGVMAGDAAMNEIRLPKPETKGRVSIEEGKY